MRPNSSRGERACTMAFLLRMGFWLAVVLVVLPSGGTQPLPQGRVSASEALSAARAAVSDMGLFCDRQPDACMVGSSTAVTIGQRAQAGAKMIYEFLSEQVGPNETGSVAPRSRGAPAPPATASQDTLTPSDQAPVWRGPQPRRDHRERPA